MQTIGIIGQGFVGQAVLEGFRRTFDVITYDIKDGATVWIHTATCSEYVASQDPLQYLVEHTDGPIFLCLPTPMSLDGSCDTSIVRSVVEELSLLAPANKPIVIKSTVPPGTTELLQSTYPNLALCFNPEFLTEKQATQDFLNQDRIIVGGGYPTIHDVCNAYKRAFPGVTLLTMCSVDAEMVKYMTNVALAVRVSLANELKQIADRVGAHYDVVAAASQLDPRLGDSHWEVPGPDGHLGFGGSCFPKDLNALTYVARALGLFPFVMTAAWMKNLEVRPERDWEQLKGRAVAV